jgi:hypothetical protein
MEQDFKPKFILKNGNVQGPGLKALTKEQLRENQKKAVQVREANKKKRQTAKAVLQELLASDSTDNAAIEVLKGKNMEQTELATLLLNMTKRASKSANMAELVFRLTGDLQEAPQQNITIVNQLTDEQLLAERNRILNSGDSCINITPEPPKLEE